MLGQPQIEVLENLKRSSIRWIASHGLGLPEAEDIFQQSLLKAITTPTQAEEEEKLTAWFHRILKNTMIDEFRKQKLQKTKTEEYIQDIKPELDAQTEQNLCQCVKGMISDLPPLDRKILEDHFFEGKKFKTLSEEFGQTESAIRVRALRTREKLKDQFKACCNATSLNHLQNCGCD